MDEASADPPVAAPRPALRPAPYLGIFRRLRVKGDDAWTIAIHWGVSLVSVLFIVFLVFGFYFTLPSPMHSVDAGTGKFSEQRAQAHVDVLVNTIGSHPYGSVANRQSVTSYIIGQLTRIQEETRVNGVDRISFEIQDHHGEVLPNFFSKDYKYVWESMGNILVQVHASRPNTAALLVSGHFDTVTMSKGASDNIAAVSSMLELIEVLAYDEAAKHEAIFAFVNGEEIGLLGAADLTYYTRKFRRASVFLNVDGTPGSKQIVLRTTGGTLETLYGSVPRPLAFVVAGDIFSTGIVDSDTDYSVYSQKLPGMDLVTFSHRQIYHTLKDDKLPEGLLQFQGDNMLALIRKITSLDVDSLLSLESDREPHVFFSFLNRGYAVYSLNANYIVFVMLIVGYVIIYAVILIHRYLYWKDMGMGSSSNPFICLVVGAAFIFLSFVASFGVVCLFGLLSTLFSPMFSYTSPGIIFFAFMPLTMTALYTSQWVLRYAEKHWKSPLEVNRHRLLWGTGVCWWILLIFTSGAAKTTGSTYLLFFLALFHLISVVLHHIFFFFGIVNERVTHDMYEVMENAENAEDEEDKRIYDETGEVKRRAMRPVEHQRWRAAFSAPDWAWFLVGLMGTLPPMLMYLDVMVPFLQMAATDLQSWVVAPLVAILVFLLNLNFLPLTRRGHHYGVIASVLLIISILTYFPLIIGGATTFTSRAPYQVVPSQVNNILNLEPEHHYSYSLRSVAKRLVPDKEWACERYSCSASGFDPPPLPVTHPIAFPPHGFQYAAFLSTPNSWVHRIEFPAGTTEALLNGIYTRLDPHNSTVNFLLASSSSTSNWTVEYNGPNGLFLVESWWDELANAPAIAPLVDKLPSWITFKGRGSWLASRRYSVSCV